MKIAVIPARGGSKRIPRKNIRPFFGKPMISWSIDAAIQSQCFDRIIVSTDDVEIAEVALGHGAEVPFVRPAELSDDYTGTVPVMAHAIDWFVDQGLEIAQVCCLYATAPFMRGDDIRRGLEIFQSENCDYAFAVTDFAFPIQRAIQITKQGRIEMFDPLQFNTRSQDLRKAWHDAGQFYWGKAEAWLQGRVIFGPNSRPVILPRHRVQDIDTPEDWERAEWIFKAMRDSQQRDDAN